MRDKRHACERNNKSANLGGPPVRLVEKQVITLQTQTHTHTHTHTHTYIYIYLPLFLDEHIYNNYFLLVIIIIRAYITDVDTGATQEVSFTKANG
jgi:hypothetical protein